MAVQHSGQIQNQILFEEHEGQFNAKRTTSAVMSYYQAASLVSGYVFHGLTMPNSNPTTAQFRIFREALNTGEVLIANGNPAFIHNWSSVSLASIRYA